MARLTTDEYMTKVQEAALSGIDHSKLRNKEIMFRAIDVPFLAPRHRVEMGIIVGGVPLTLSTMREKDPVVVGNKLALYVGYVLEQQGV